MSERPNIGIKIVVSDAVPNGKCLIATQEQWDAAASKAMYDFWSRQAQAIQRTADDAFGDSWLERNPLSSKFKHKLPEDR